MNRLSDTIAAISTAPGLSAIALIRASGPDVPRLIDQLFGDKLGLRRPELRWLVHPETSGRTDHVLATFFPAPNSYTGEDMLEISCHGGPLNPQLVLDAVLAAGPRAAEPGEFTRRAYLNGKLDLLQAEAVLDLIEGRSPEFHRAAIDQLDRGLSRRIEELREAVVRCEALLVYEIDFPEEDEGPVAPERVDAAAREIVGRIDAMLEGADEGELLRDGALTVIAGRPNSGKSSLFNALCGFERAIVTEEPGTTRDAVEATISIHGFPFRLVDTAGLRETAGRVERIGIEVARRYVAGAQLIIFCVEADRDMEEDEKRFVGVERGAQLIVARTKADLPGAAGRAATQSPDDGVRVSAVTGDGIASLRDQLLSAAFTTTLTRGNEEPIITRRRHSRQLRTARDEAEAFLAARSSGLAPEVAATHLRSAAHALEELLGVIAPEDLLAQVFSQFCIGK